MSVCPCGSNAEFDRCCEPYLSGRAVPDTAEKTMRARYTAYTRADVPFLMATLHPENKTEEDEPSARKWATQSTWLGLEIRHVEAGGPGDTEGLVEFVARFRDKKGEARSHHEVSRFVKEDGRWLFREGHLPEVAPVVRATPKVGRNDPCPCGSGKKFKKCCEKA